MKQDVAQLLADVFGRIGCDGIGEFIGLFEQVPHHGTGRLLPVPGAPVRPPQPFDDAEQIGHRERRRAQFRIFHSFFNSPNFAAKSRLRSLETTIASCSETMDT